jgi:hypothetical protein
MALSVKRITLWRSDVENQPGVLARTLEPLAAAGSNLRLVMGYRFPLTPEHSAIEVFPVSGRRATAAAEQAGLRPSDIPCLLVEGEDRPGLGSEIARGLADAGLNIAFVMAVSGGRTFTAALGFADDAAATAALPVVRKVAATRRTPAAKRKAGARRKPTRRRGASRR